MKTKAKLQVLELFKGTGSISKALHKLLGDRVEVVSLDIESKYKPTICTDIMQWDYKSAFPPGRFDFIWASPVCHYYSMGKRMVRDKSNLEANRKESDKMVQRVLDIIQYFKPKAWLMENPQTGCLKTRDVVRGIPFADANYCRYGYVYSKRTRFWGNQGLIDKLKPLLKVCCKKDHCQHSSITSKGNLKHHYSIASGPSKGYRPMKEMWKMMRQITQMHTQTRTEILFSIPPALTETLMQTVIDIALS